MYVYIRKEVNWNVRVDKILSSYCKVTVNFCQKPLNVPGSGSKTHSSTNKGDIICSNMILLSLLLFTKT